jgi:hypothetical protein
MVRPMHKYKTLWVLNFLRLPGFEIRDSIFGMVKEKLF